MEDFFSDAPLLNERVSNEGNLSYAMQDSSHVLDLSRLRSLTGLHEANLRSEVLRLAKSSPTDLAELYERAFRGSSKTGTSKSLSLHGSSTIAGSHRAPSDSLLDDTVASWSQASSRSSVADANNQLAFDKSQLLTLSRTILEICQTGVLTNDSAITRYVYWCLW